MSERLKQFKGWLQVKGYDANAALVPWWIAEFEEAEEKRYPDRRHTLH